MALDTAGAAVVQAPPGTGKTTVVPPALAERLRTGRVVVTQPRRVAVRAAARRLAHLSGTALGGRSGYTVRGDRAVSAATRVEFVTPGVLVRRLLADPDLPGVGAVVLDEVHERTLGSDLLFALLAELRELRDDLLVVPMSATVDATRFAALLGGTGGPVPVVDTPTALHPLDVRYRPATAARLDGHGVTDAFLVHVATEAVAAHRETGHDGLVFVPGAREVDRVVGLLRAALPDVEIAPLHGRLPAAEQDRAVSAPGGPRLVVTTAVAESSLTVPGVRLVVDAGLSREPRRDTARDMTGLVTVSASRDSCEQRAGRAARLGPGVAVRCLSTTDWAHMAPHRTPEIATADLTGLLLDLACWGNPRGDGLALPDPPPQRAAEAAEATLRGLGAVDDAGAVTACGRRLARLPLDPRPARALLRGTETLGAARSAEVVALLGDDMRTPDGDLESLLADLRAGRGGGRGEPARRWRREADRLRRAAEEGAGTRRAGERDAGRDAGRDAAGADGAATDVGLVVALAHPDRIAHRDGTTFLLASGTRAGASGTLARHEWLAVAEVARATGRVAAGTGAVIRAAAPIDRAVAEKAAAHLLRDETTAVFTDGRVTARRTRSLGAIPLAAAAVRPTAEQAHKAVAAAVTERGLRSVLPLTGTADDLRLRLALLHRTLGTPWPDVSDAALSAGATDFFAPELDALAAGTDAARIDMPTALRRLLPWPEAGRLDALAPDRLPVPSGSRVRLEYPAPDAAPDTPPVLRVKLQECFGWVASPTIADGRVPVQVHLLSPAGRPLAVTGDLAYFWTETYPGVRAEMRGRYPRHPWPEDPRTAEATARTRRRR